METFFSLGPDASFYQDNDQTVQKIDFQKMKAAGAEFVIIRAGQSSWEDEDFRHNWQAAKEAGLPRGTYWFFDSRSSPGTQANIWRLLVGNDLPELGFWYDLEEHYGGAFPGWKNWKQLIQIMQAYYPDSVHGIYTSPSYWTENSPLNSNDWAFFKALPLWIANYKVIQPAIPAPWTDWLFWQFTASGDGLAYGAESLEIDLNYFNGDVDALRSYFHLSGEVSTGGSMQIIKGYAKGTVRRRSAPNTDDSSMFSPQRYLVAGDEIEAAYPNQAQWLNLKKINGVELTEEEWSSAGSVQQYISWQVVEVPDETDPPPAPAELPDVLYVGTDPANVTKYQKVI